MFDLASIFAVLLGVIVIGFFVYQLIETSRETKKLENKK